VANTVSVQKIESPSASKLIKTGSEDAVGLVTFQVFFFKDNSDLTDILFSELSKNFSFP
jgi:hypothetical protein